MTQSTLRAHFARYPLMEPADAVKLLYQNEFGCEHVLADEPTCAARVAAEREGLQGPDAPPFVAIGNRLCRLELRDSAYLPAERIARMMRLTAACSHGDADSFQQKLGILTTLCDGGEAPFSAGALADYLRGYALLGYPAVHHSPAYRAAYAPAYRVVRRLYGAALPILRELERRIAENGRALLVLDGDCGAGKTTLAAALAELYGARVIPMDDFFLPPALRTAERLAEPGGNVHRERFAAEVLPALVNGRAFAYHRFDCHTGAFVTREVPAAGVTIIEGSYSLHPAFHAAFRALGAVCARLTVEEAEQLRRIAARGDDPSRFREKWIPLEKRYFEAYHSTRDDTVVLRSEREDEP